MVYLLPTRGIRLYPLKLLRDAIMEPPIQIQYFLLYAARTYRFLGNMVDPPLRSMPLYNSFLISISHFTMELYEVSLMLTGSIRSLKVGTPSWDSRRFQLHWWWPADQVLATPLRSWAAIGNLKLLFILLPARQSQAPVHIQGKRRRASPTCPSQILALLRLLKEWPCSVKIFTRASVTGGKVETNDDVGKGIDSTAVACTISRTHKNTLRNK